MVLTSNDFDVMLGDGEEPRCALQVLTFANCTSSHHDRQYYEEKVSLNFYAKWALEPAYCACAKATLRGITEMEDRSSHDDAGGC